MGLVTGFRWPVVMEWIERLGLVEGNSRLATKRFHPNSNHERMVVGIGRRGIDDLPSKRTMTTH